MKKFTLLFIFILLIIYGQAQDRKGKIIVEHINSPSLQNTGGENPIRRVSIYLPPDYDQTTNRYPVLYYLHGFTWSDSLQIVSDRFDQLLDKAITTGKIRPVIVVMPNHHTLYRGSFYTNSSLTGNWADFTAKDLVKHIDQNYRTIPDKYSRGITGHSMGGHGAIKLGMLFPDVFTSVYALSPGVLTTMKEIGPNGQAYKQAQQINTKDELMNHFFANVAIALGRAYSPNPSRPPFYCDLPYSYSSDSLIIDHNVLDLWNKNSPLGMVDEYRDNLKKLKALKLDWGRNEEFEHIPTACLMFSEKLENLGINHYAEEYIGTHGDKLWTDDGRALNDMLPFFDTYLKFEDVKLKRNVDAKKAKMK